MPSPKSARRSTPGSKAAAPAKSKSAITKKGTASVGASKKSAPKKAATKAPGKKVASPKSAAPKKAGNKALASKTAVKKAASKNIAHKKATVKKAVSKKAPGKASTAASKAIVKKALVKKAAKKAVVKAAVKKAIVKKAIVKKAIVKKAIVKKAIVNKAVGKKVAAKKAEIKKAVVKKAIVKKAVAKKAAGAIQKAAGLDSRGQLERLLQSTMAEAIFAQKRFQKIINKLARSSSDSALKNIFLEQQGDTAEVLKKLESAFAAQNWKSKTARSPALEGILQETENHIAEYPKGEGLDAALMAGSKKFRLFESGTFSVLSRLAKLLGREKLAQIFDLLRQGSELLDSKVHSLSESGSASTEATSESDRPEGMQMDGEGSEDSQAGEDSSSHVSGNEDMSEEDGDGENEEEDLADEGEISWSAKQPDTDEDSELKDGGDREGESETGEPMGY